MKAGKYTIINTGSGCHNIVCKEKGRYLFFWCDGTGDFGLRGYDINPIDLSLEEEEEHMRWVGTRWEAIIFIGNVLKTLTKDLTNIEAMSKAADLAYSIGNF